MAEIGELITICNGRLTLTSGVPVTTSDVTAATTVYFTPYLGDHIALWNGEAWIFHQFEELSLSLSGYTADTNYDIWMYNNAGVLTLESTAWSSDTARATALATLNGIYVKSGDALRRYLGTIRTTGTIGQCEDSVTKRFVWNFYNQVRKPEYVMNATQHTYMVMTYRPWNNDTSVRIEIVVGLLINAVTLQLTARSYASATELTRYNSIGQNSTTQGDGRIYCTVADNNAITIAASTDYYPTSIGYNYYQVLEQATASGTSTFVAVYFKMGIWC